MEQISNFLWPYDDVEILRYESGVEFKAPWVKVKYPQTISDVMFQKIQTLRDEGPKDLNDFRLMDSLFRPLVKYPLCYLLPVSTKKSDLVLQSYTVENDRIKKQFANLNVNADLVAQDCLSEWDIESILKLSLVSNDMYDPITVLSFFRYNHLKDVMGYLSAAQKNISLLNLNDQKLRDATLLFLRQNHYVTERCEEVLTPALSCHSHASAKIKEFIKEEQGHDKLLSLSFKRLKINPNDIEILSSLETMMNIFKMVANTNLIAFCFIVDMFERSPEGSKNPIVQSLKKLGEDEAAVPILSHSNINVDGDHDNESFEILNTIGLVPKSYIVEALNLAKVASDQMLSFLEERNQKLIKIHDIEKIS